MKLREIDFGNILGASGVQGFLEKDIGSTRYGARSV